MKQDKYGNFIDKKFDGLFCRECGDSSSGLLYCITCIEKLKEESKNEWTLARQKTRGNCRADRWG